MAWMWSRPCTPSALKPRVVLTVSQYRHRVAAVKYGAIDYLPKPAMPTTFWRR